MNTQEACDLAITLMVKHGLMTETPSTWHFEFDAATTRLGLCRFKTRTISLSRRLTEVNTRETVLDTILHEIAHALQPLAGHGRIWKLQCMALGAKPQACARASDVVTLQGKYVATCPGCGAQFHKHARPRYKKPRACRACCHGRFDARFILEYRPCV